MSKLTDLVYQYSPVWFQNLGISLYGLMWRQRRFGGVFPEELEGFVARNDWSLEQWPPYQEERLRRLLLESLHHVPYYRESFRQAGLDEKRLGALTLADLPDLPMVSKEDIRAAQADFTSEAYANETLHTYATSGTTGTPVGILFSTGMHQTWSAAYEHRCRHFAGVDNSMSRAMIGGRLVVTTGQAEPPFWRTNYAERQLYMSAFHISPETAPLYAKALKDFDPDYLVGYASSHFFLARFLVEQGLEACRPKAILTSSEKLTAEMRETMERAYGCEVFDAYSGVEACCLASECEQHRLHVSPDVGIIELLDEAGQPVGPGEVGEVVATGLLNFAQPLIRYRTGDYAILSDEDCPCGRQMPVLEELVGRLEDTVIGADGRETVRFHGIFVGMDRIREGQVVQETVTDFTLRLAVTEGFGDADRAELERRFQERLGDIHIDYEYVDQIERTSRGKFRAVISKVERKSSGPS